MPELDDVARSTPTRVDRAAAGAAADVVRLVEDLLELWAAEPPKVLRSGGVGVRERARAATALDVDEPRAGAARRDRARGRAARPRRRRQRLDAEVWLPTPAYDGWLDEPVEVRWATLARAWLTSTRVAGLAGSQDERGQAHCAAARPRPGPHGAPGGPRRRPAPTWPRCPPAPRRRPRRCRPGCAGRRRAAAGRLHEDLVTWTMTEAAAARAVTGGRAGGPRPGAARGRRRRRRGRAGRGCCPSRWTTCCCRPTSPRSRPGPLDPALARSVRLRRRRRVHRRRDRLPVHATATVRRALDAGWTAAEVLALLAGTRGPRCRSRWPTSSRTSRGGTAGSGSASRRRSCAATTRRPRGAARRQAAPPPCGCAGWPRRCWRRRRRRTSLLDRLREAGLRARRRRPDGDVVVRRPESRRTTAAPPGAAPGRCGPQPLPGDTLLTRRCGRIRGGDRSRLVGASTHRRPTADVLAMLTRPPAPARHCGSATWTRGPGHPAGWSSRSPSRAGYLNAYDHLRGAVRSFAVHRITGVSPLDDDAGS